MIVADVGFTKKLCYTYEVAEKLMKRIGLGLMLIVNTLGKFQVMNEDGVLNENDIRSTMLSKLLVYMLIYREHALTIEEISTALWQGDETDNPAGALKNLMYRLRALLKKYFGDTEFILTNRGAYRWNPEVEVVLDAEHFEKLFEQAKDKRLSESERISCYEKAIQICQGDFMPKITDMHWVVTLSTYYHSMFLNAIKGLAQLYIHEEKYDELENICIRALKIDNVDETLHYYLVLSHVRNNNAKLAIESYEKACTILYKELGVRNPKKLQEIHDEILKMDHGTQTGNIEDVQDDMLEENPEGVFLCGYPVFKAIYQLEVRKTTRVGIAEFVLLLTFETESGKTDEELDQADRFRINQAMEKLELVLKQSLRIGDVAAKYSASQYIVLLPNCNYESSLLVANRIISNFYNENKKYNSLKIKMNLDEVSASEFVK